MTQIHQGYTLLQLLVMLRRCMQLSIARGLEL